MTEPLKEIVLPPRETWDAGLMAAEEMANTTIRSYDTAHKVIKVEERGEPPAPTVEEVKLSVGFLVARRMVIEARADLLHNSMAAERARKIVMGHPSLPMAERRRVAEALAVKEGCGVKLAHGWRVMEQGLRQWQNPGFWKHRDPVKEARKLFLAIQGLEEREIRSGNEDKGEEGQRDPHQGGNPGGQQAGVRGEAGEGEAEGRRDLQDGEGERQAAAGAGQREGSPGGEDKGVQGVQETPGRQDQGAAGEDRG